MARAYLTVHDRPREVYERLDVVEQTSENATWKTIKAGSIEVVYFRTAPGEANDA